jgi:putative aminopeptidase FrvX
MIEKLYADFAWEQAAELLAIDSPTGYTNAAAAWVKNAFEALGFKAFITTKGGVIADLGGKDENDGLLLAAHADTLGAMVHTIKGNGRLKLTSLGGMNPNNAETENVRVYTRDGKVYEGTCQLANASIHVNGSYNSTQRSWDTVEIVLDEDVSSAADTRKLGIEVGDIVCFDPRTKRTASGYLKSRFLDDKLSVGILLGFAKYLSDNKIVPQRRTWCHVTVYEEVGHGGSGSAPAGITEAIAVDMGCVGDGLQCTEKQVSICAKDSGGPYSYDVVGKLIAAAKATEADYAVDIYPFYSSDVGATLRSGADIRHGLIGSGVYASHGYERSHIDGVYNTLKVLAGYLEV